MDETAQEKRIREGAERYAAAQRSDPFALARAQAHIRNGIAGIRAVDNENYKRKAGEDAFYDATPVADHRTLVDGTQFIRQGYNDLKRP